MFAAADQTQPPELNRPILKIQADWQAQPIERTSSWLGSKPVCLSTKNSRLLNPSTVLQSGYLEWFMAGWTIDLSAPVSLITPDMLPAIRAGEFEFRRETLRNFSRAGVLPRRISRYRAVAYADGTSSSLCCRSHLVFTHFTPAFQKHPGLRLPQPTPL